VDTLPLRQVSVWLDELAPQHGAFTHALEWASRLALPLHGVTATPGGWGGRMVDYHRAEGEGPGRTERLEACATACARRSVSWNASRWQGPPADWVKQFLRPAELCVFGDALPPRLKDELLRGSLRRRDVAILLCPRPWEPVSRVLVLHEHRDPGNRFLDAAARLCQAFDVTPVVLTVARTEREARLRQDLAEERFATRRRPADFDFIVGCEVRTAVAWAARWRRCSHVVLERESAPPWWPRLRGDTLQRLLGLSDALTVLALPGAGQALRPPAGAGTLPKMQ
jgi:hypothetical protein